MNRTSILRRLWAVLTRPRQPVIPRILRQRSTHQRTAQGLQVLRTDHDYDRAIRDYLALWLNADTDTASDHYQVALLHFGLSRDEAEFVDQVLYSAAFGTLPNWVNCKKIPGGRPLGAIPRHSTGHCSTDCAGKLSAHSDAQRWL